MSCVDKNQQVPMAKMSREQLQQFLAEQQKAYKAFQDLGLKLDMSRGKPCTEILDQSNGLYAGMTEFKDASGQDVRNYGGLTGIPEARALFSEIFGVPADQVIMGGSSSLDLMFDMIGMDYVRGVGAGQKPWDGQKIKFLCPSPGYDRHFTLCEYFGIEMITIPMLADGPDMDMVESLVKDDASIKGIWCVPMYSNPDGITYSDEVVRRLAAMPTAAEDFRIFCDCAYVLHHLYPNDRDHLLNMYQACAEAGHADRIYMFASTSKVTTAGGGLSAMAMSPANCDWVSKQMAMRAICYDKVNMLRHCRFLPNLAAVDKLMMEHAEILRPKFQTVDSILEKELAPLQVCRWMKPKGGYFISFYAPKGCAKRIVALCKEAGVVLTGAGASYPYGKDPDDSNIRLSPSFPTIPELEQAMELFCVAVKICAAEKMLAE